MPAICKAFAKPYSDAAQPKNEEKVAVTAIAALQICHERNPERGLTLERLVTDPTFSEEGSVAYEPGAAEETVESARIGLSTGYDQRLIRII